MLHRALAAPYPPGNPAAPPLEFDLEVVESRPPTADQLRTILSYIAPRRDAAPPAPSAFLSAHPSGAGEQPHSVKGVVRLAEQNPNALKWPIVVDWIGGRASVGDVEGVKGILEAIRQQRDGEAKQEEGVDQPKGWFS